MLDKLFTVAPILGKAISGDIGGAATAALEAFGIDTTGNQDKDKALLERAIKTASPEQLVELRRIDAEWEVKLKEMDLDLEKLVVGDRDSARKMHMENKEKIVPILGFLTVVTIIPILFGLFFIKIPNGNRDTIIYIIGQITGWAGAVYTFYYGSSNGSQKKDKMMGSR